jgi:hypothetical protein
MHDENKTSEELVNEYFYHGDKLIALLANRLDESLLKCKELEEKVNNLDEALRKERGYYG